LNRYRRSETISFAIKFIMDLKACYKILEIPESASEEDIKQAYRDMIGIWHPDRYVQNPRLHKKATEKLKDLNIAYNRLRTCQPADAGQYRHSKPSSPATDGHSMIVTCPNCHQINYLKAGFARHEAACGACGTLFFGKKRRFLNKWTVLVFTVATFMILMNAKEIRHRTSQGLKHIADGRYGEYFRAPLSSVKVKENSEKASSAILEMQQLLQNFGYGIGPPDGRLGEQTWMALNQFHHDFFIAYQMNNIEQAVQSLRRQQAIVRQHPDWPQIVKDPHFKQWIERQAITTPKICMQVLERGNVDQVVSLIDGYAFDRLQPRPLPLPRSGILDNVYRKGMAPLTIRTRDDGKHYFLKLRNASDGSRLFSAFIRSGATLEARIPVGTYRLKYAVGDTWYGDRWLFGSKTVYKKMDQLLEFKIQQREIAGYRLDLYLQAVDKSHLQKDYAFDF